MARTNYATFDATSESEDRNFHVAAAEKFEDDGNACSTQRSHLPAPSAPSHEFAHQAAASTSPGSMYESDRIPVRRYLTLRAEESRVEYCFTFSQDSGEGRLEREQRQDAADSEAPQSDTLVSYPNHE